MVVYVCLSDYFPSDKRLLHCRKGERFVIIQEAKGDPNWLYGISGLGDVGYLPRSYMIPDRESPHQEALEFIDYVLEVMHEKASKTSFSNGQRQALKKLAEMRSACLQQQKSSSPSGSNLKPTEASIRPSSVLLTTDDAARLLSSHNNVVSPHENNSSSVSSQTCTNNENDVGRKECSSQTDETEKSSSSIQCVPFQLNCETQMSLDHDVMQNQPESSEKTQGDMSSPLVDDTIKNGDFEMNDQSNSDVIPKTLVPELIERVRNRTQLSHTLSVEAVHTVVECIADVFPSLGNVWQEMLKQLNSSKAGIGISTASAVVSKDRERLHTIFQKLWSCKNDEQQRSWPIHEDENTIQQLLEELIVLLVDANPLICQEVIKEDSYENILMLVTYYQMEPRRSLRLAMLQLFQIFCELDVAVIGCLLNSILPMELARDMVSNSEDILRFKHSAKILTIVFCTGDKPPLPVYEQVNEAFVSFLLNAIENSVDGEEAEEIGDACLALLLAFNLHFKSDNFIISAIKKHFDCKVLLEKLLLLFNREVDPTCLIKLPADMLTAHKNSVIKMLCDLFGDKDAAQLFYTNDICVLLDIIVRQLTDLPVSEKSRLNYLHLAQNVIRNSSYDEHYHQQDMFQKCFSVSLANEFTCQAEKDLINSIISEFSLWFHV